MQALTGFGDFGLRQSSGALDRPLGVIQLPNRHKTVTSFFETNPVGGGHIGD
jgi:hypothetical protein